VDVARRLRIVAEDIEDSATLQLLSDLGCDFAQGYCMSKPKPASELAFRSHLVAGPASGPVNGSHHPLVGVGPDTTATP
jgi:predicted signal transduction protein with EAL and GGDEF domain